MAELHPIRAYRDEKGLTLEQFGAEFGVDKSTVKRWEMGSIPAERVRSISEFTGISQHDLRPDLWDAPAPAMAAE